MSDFRNMLERTAPGHFAPIEFDNGLRMSIQAGNGMYSSPRENRSNPHAYSAFEVAFVKPSIGFVNPLGLDMGDQVMGYVETDKVQEMYEAAKAISPETIEAINTEYSPWASYDEDSEEE